MRVDGTLGDVPPQSAFVLVSAAVAVSWLRKIRGESLALQGGDEADQQYSSADDGTDGIPTQSLIRLAVIVCIDGEEYPSREI
jgi:hypothetical protein